MIHHIYANQSNAGDWLSARGIQALLAPFECTEHFCDTPFVPETVRRLQDASERDLIILGGGGLFMDYFVPFWDAFAPVSTRVPFVVWGAGCCDMKREHTRVPEGWLERILGRSRICIVRDDLSRRLLPGCALPEPVPCPTVVAVPHAERTARGVLHVDHFDNVGADIHEFMVAESRRFAEASGRPYRQSNNLLPAGHAGALQRILDLYRLSDVIVTSRLHGCIIGLATGRPVLAVSADHKVESFMQAAGLADWVIGLEDVETLPARLRRLETQPAATAFIDEARAKNRAVAAQVRALIDALGAGDSSA
jgi:polysaccharide pyruvyl transferase WcaK-like protein